MLEIDEIKILFESVKFYCLLIKRNYISIAISAIAIELQFWEQNGQIVQNCMIEKFVRNCSLVLDRFFSLW